MPPKKKRKCTLPIKTGFLKLYLDENFSTFPVDGEVLNGHVLSLFVQKERSFPNTISSLLEKTSVPVPRHFLKTLVDRSILKFRNLSRETDKIKLDDICR